MRAFIALLFLTVTFPRGGAAEANPYFKIQVVDEQSRRGVPLVELRTVNGVRFWTDSNGIIAFNEPGMMNRETWFFVRSDGYEFPKDGFGNAGLRLTPKAGRSHTIKMKRLNIAERVYRVTGEGIYRDSILTGHPVPLRRPVLNGEVTGQDTVIVTPYRGKLYWFWGDTDRLAYPLGNFAVTGATSEFPGHGGLDPAVGVDLTYFTNKDGFARQICPDFGPGLHWIEGVFSLPDSTGRERLIARVSSQRGLQPAYAWHLAVWDDAKEHFVSTVKWDIHLGHDSAHPFRAKVGGVEYIYLYPNYRVRADWQSVTNLAAYESFTCLNGADQARRDGEGNLQWNWVPGAERLHAGRLHQLIRDGVLKREESWMRLQDAKSGAAVEFRRGSVFWNEYRKRWILIGWANSGEIWYSECKSPTGPWIDAVKVMEHENYTFYNPTQHPFFDQDGGKTIYFEGTYTAEFSAAREKTPRYNYNQIMYRLDLADPRLKLPETSEILPGADAEVSPVPVQLP